MQKLMGLVRRCVEDYRMINEGDRIAVGVSGGKDSLVLLTLLAGLRSYYNKPFQLGAITIDMGLNMDYSSIYALCQKLDVPYTVVKTEVGPIIFDYRKEKNPCSMCSKMRRGALNQALLEQGYNKLALGHHYDDAVETLLMSLIFEGRISCFQPVTNLDRTGVIQIRPMLYIHEKTVDHFAQQQGLPVLTNRCPVDKHTKREEVKDLIFDLVKTYPDLKGILGGSMSGTQGLGLAIDEMGVADKIAATGTCIPSVCAEYLESGALNCSSFWDPAGAGYATNKVALLALSGEGVTDGMDLGYSGYSAISLVDNVVYGADLITATADNMADYPF